MLEELVSAGLRTKFPFTLDPKPPLDFHNLGLTPQQKEEFNTMFRDEARYQEGMSALGLRDRQSYTCSPYLPEAGNIPVRGSVLAWSESSCVVYANSVLAARTNRNAAIVDLFSNLLGSTPLFGLLTDEGRKADWCIEIRTQKLPPPQLLGVLTLPGSTSSSDPR
jgi:predicted aconitase